MPIRYAPYCTRSIYLKTFSSHAYSPPDGPSSLSELSFPSTFCRCIIFCCCFLRFIFRKFSQLTRGFVNGELISERRKRYALINSRTGANHFTYLCGIAYIYSLLANCSTIPLSSSRNNPTIRTRVNDLRSPLRMRKSDFTLYIRVKVLPIPLLKLNLSFSLVVSAPNIQRTSELEQSAKNNR